MTNADMKGWKVWSVWKVYKLYSMTLNVTRLELSLTVFQKEHSWSSARSMCFLLSKLTFAFPSIYHIAVCQNLLNFKDWGARVRYLIQQSFIALPWYRLNSLSPSFLGRFVSLGVCGRMAQAGTPKPKQEGCQIGKQIMKELQSACREGILHNDILALSLWNTQVWFKTPTSCEHMQLILVSSHFQ